MIISINERGNFKTMENLKTHTERIEKAESLLIKRIPSKATKEIKQQIARDFKTLVSGLNVSKEFFLKDMIKQKLISSDKKSSFEKKINNFIESAEIKTENVFFYKENGLNCGVSIDCFIMML